MMIIVFAALIVMLIFIGLRDGLMKALLIFGIFITSIILALLMMRFIGVDKWDRIVIGRLILGVWAVGLILYNILTGNIKNT